MTLSVCNDGAKMSDTPRKKSVQVRHETFSPFAKTIFYSWGNLKINLADDNAVVFQIA